DNTKVGWGPLLVVMYAISQLTSSYLMSATMQPAQRALMLILPIAFIPFVLNFPAGLMLYWLTTNLWTTGQGLITRKLTPKREPPPKKSSRTPPRSEVAAKAERPAQTSVPSEPKQGQNGPPRVKKVKRKKGGARR
ncbi:MAG: YidC/Oxa1 family membrane protein insertase, partial [Gaiellaceae bacterium]